MSITNGLKKTKCSCNIGGGAMGGGTITLGGGTAPDVLVTKISLTQHKNWKNIQSRDKSFYQHHAWRNKNVVKRFLNRVMKMAE